MATRLSNAALGSLPAGVPGPKYDRAALSAGILHFGIGNFHRAHQAMYLDSLFGTGKGHDFAILGAGVMPGDAKARDVLGAQDWLTTLIEQDANHAEARVLGSMVGYLPIGDGDAIVSALADPAIRIVSLTVTEGGYFLDAKDRFDPTHPAIVADAENPDEPKTVFGLILKGLKARRDAGQQPFTIMCCDNIPHNGSVTRGTLTGLARLSDPALADWITEKIAFPNGMVDRITPATSDRERRICAEEWGIEDGWPVFCEPFAQWVLEDDFPAGRPPLEDVGVQFVPDVIPFELMKLRILNAGHAIIAYPAGLLDVEFVHEAMEHPLVGGFLERVEREEIIPGIPPVPDTDTSEYFKLIQRRFSNPKIADTIRRLCLDGSNRQPKFVLPAIRDSLDAGRTVDGLALESALWCRYCYGTTESGAEIAPNDPNWDRLQARAREAKESPRAWLGMTEVYGDLSSNETFAAAFEKALSALWADGTEATLRRYIGA